MKRYLFLIIAVIATAFIAVRHPLIGMQHSTGNISLGDRPESVQKEVDAAFERLQMYTPNWEYGGQRASLKGMFGGRYYYSEFYYTMDINDALLIEDIASREKNDIYLMDFGAGAGGWGHEAMALLEKKFKNSNKHFHIISITGSNELTSKTTHTGNISLYEFGNFKLENVESELKKYGFDLTNKIDLIVAAWTLTHFVDAVGTFKQLYSLLSPDNGVLVSNGFYFKVNGGSASGDYNRLFYENGASYVFLLRYDSTAHARTPDILIIKKDKHPFTPPLDYTGKVEDLQMWHHESKKITDFKSNYTPSESYWANLPICKAISYRADDNLSELLRLIEQTTWLNEMVKFCR